MYAVLTRFQRQTGIQRHCDHKPSHFACGVPRLCLVGVNPLIFNPVIGCPIDPLINRRANHLQRNGCSDSGGRRATKNTRAGLMSCSSATMLRAFFARTRDIARIRGRGIGFPVCRLNWRCIVWLPLRIRLIRCSMLIAFLFIFHCFLRASFDSILRAHAPVIFDRRLAYWTVGAV